jgi:glutamyl-tRNA synthetase
LTLKEIKEAIRKHALINAVSYGGTAQAKSVIGRLFAEQPRLRQKIQEITPLVVEVVKEVNRLSPDKQRRIIEGKWPEALVRGGTEEKRKLPPLPNADKYKRIVTRFSPNPDCVLHLGSARAIILSHEYAKMYGGIFYLRFEDTDPRLKKSALQFYESIREDLTWLGCGWDAEFIQSDRLPIYYKHAEKLLKAGHAYVCTCEREAFREKIGRREACPCRILPPNEQVTRWRRMLDGTYGEGEGVVRVKTDLNHPNPAVRDWPAFRIINAERYPHPRVGSRYRVWPLYNFACGVDDHLLGITHVIRGKEHLTNQARQEYLYRHFGWTYPEAIHYGRLKITGASLSKSKILAGFRERVYKLWDDPRLATFAALRRRGIMPEAIRGLIVDVGPKAADVTLSWENLYAHNRKIIDPDANRYFFVQNPQKLTVKVPRGFTSRIPLHPDYPDRGVRVFEVESKAGEASLLVSGGDMKIIVEEAKLRLMELFNVEVERVAGDSIEAVFLSESYEAAKRLGIHLIHWIPASKGFPGEVVMPDGSFAEGVVEEACKKLRVGDVVQFERFGFVRIDSLDEKLTAYFAHR